MLKRMNGEPGGERAQKKACCASPKLLTFALEGGGSLTYCNECRNLIVRGELAVPEPRVPTPAEQRAFARRNAQVFDQVVRIFDSASVTRQELLYACAGYAVSVSRASNQDPIEHTYAQLNMLEVMRARMREAGE